MGRSQAVGLDWLGRYSDLRQWLECDLRDSGFQDWLEGFVDLERILLAVSVPVIYRCESSGFFFNRLFA